MSVATLGRLCAPTLPELVDALAARTGAWVVVERFGDVLCHGTGATECPAALVQSLLTKRTASLRSAVRWTRSSGLARGALGQVVLLAAELGEGTTAWFLGCEVTQVQEALPLLHEALSDEGAAVHDTVFEELLHPRGPARRGAAPAALIVALQSELPARRLARTVLAAVAGTPTRVHVEGDIVLLALAPDDEPTDLITRLRSTTPSLSGGLCRVDDDASDWVTAGRLATASLQAAVALDRPVGDPRDPAVAAELVLQEAQAAVGDLGRLLDDGPLRRLQDHDARTAGELVASLTGWCRAGFDVPTAAAALHVHANTLRYRLKRAGEISGLDLNRPRQLLALQLLLAV
ncbi:MAG: PucR family transcriptional regulator [Frankiales bacterium]|jgi:hypothetical protein|nr:PucR family transcriptional regulator [Frankiales bacterium]